MTKLSALEEDILTVLSHGTDYGFSILKKLNEAYHPNEMQQGTLYPTLHRMKKKGLVTQHWGSGRGMKRQYYTLTDEGKELLAARLRTLKEVGRPPWHLPLRLLS